MTFPLTPRDPRVHVFAVGPGPLRLARRTYLSGGAEGEGDATLAEAFGVPVDEARAEVFDVADIEPLSLADYLAQAHDIAPDAISASRARLDAARGQVAVLSPRAVEGIDALEPDPQLEHLASLAPARADDAPRDLPPATRTVEQPRLAPADAAPRSRTILWVALTALVLAALALALLAA